MCNVKQPWPVLGMLISSQTPPLGSCRLTTLLTFLCTFQREYTNSLLAPKQWFNIPFLLIHNLLKNVSTSAVKADLTSSGIHTEKHCLDMVRTGSSQASELQGPAVQGTCSIKGAQCRLESFIYVLVRLSVSVQKVFQSM